MTGVHGEQGRSADAARREVRCAAGRVLDGVEEIDDEDPVGAPPREAT